MDPITGAALIGGGATLLGGVMGSMGTAATNANNVRMMHEQMSFQREMSNTAYQRSTKDMLKAGLNPMLAYSEGGASTPAGATASFENPMGPISEAMSSAVSQYVGLQQRAADIEQTKAQTKSIEAGIPKKEAEGSVYEGAAGVVRDVKSKISEWWNKVGSTTAEQQRQREKRREIIKQGNELNDSGMYSSGKI